MKALPPLNLPQANLKLGRKGDQIFVWDILRKKNLVLSPEEWVRQHLFHYLKDALGYPLGSFALEGGFRLMGRLQRTDILIYKNSSPQLLVECKAPSVTINQDTFDQALRYNLHYKVPFLLISNGLEHYWAAVEEGGLQFIREPVMFSDL